MLNSSLDARSKLRFELVEEDRLHQFYYYRGSIASNASAGIATVEMSVCLSVRIFSQ